MEWVASWAVFVRKPSDLGYEDDNFRLPEISYIWHEVNPEHKTTSGYLFPLPASSLSERISARRDSVVERVAKALEIVNERPDEQWLIWCGLNQESDELQKAIPGAVEVKGSDNPDHKTESMLSFADGKIRALVSKPSICGFGMNFQSCRNMLFVGLSDSWEQYYQAVRRCWRFGQTQHVYCHVITCTTEGAVVKNIKRKEKEAEMMTTELCKRVSRITKEHLDDLKTFTTKYNPETAVQFPSFLNR